MWKVLLVDDEPFILEGIKVLIDWNKAGYEIAGSVGSAEDAYDIIMKEHIDLVCTDVKLPQMSGIDLLEKVRDEGRKDVSFIIMSGYSDFEFVRNALKYGSIDYLLKPIDRKELIRALHRLDEKNGAGGIIASYTFQNPNNGKNDAAKCTEEKDNTEDSINKRQADGILAKIEAETRVRYRENITLKDLSKKYFINSAYLGQIFKKEYGEPYKDFLKRVRVEKAEEFLLTTDRKIYDIAQEVGYKDVDYFIDTFISINGCTPAKYRKRRVV